MTSLARAVSQDPSWYRHRWPWLLMLGPALVIVAGLCTTLLAITSNDGLVADDYYKRGLAINRTLERAERARSLGLSAMVDIDAQGVVHVALASAAHDLSAAPGAIQVYVVHPTRAGLDRQVELLRGADGTYAGRLDNVGTGRRIVSVGAADWRLPAVEVDGALRNVRLGQAAGGS